MTTEYSVHSRLRGEFFSPSKLLIFVLVLHLIWTLHKTWKDPVLRVHTYAFLLSDLHAERTVGPPIQTHTSLWDGEGGVTAWKGEWWMKICLRVGRGRRSGSVTPTHLSQPHNKNPPTAQENPIWFGPCVLWLIQSDENTKQSCHTWWKGLKLFLCVSETMLCTF